MQDFSISTVVDMTIGLASGINDQDRFHRLLDAIRKTIQCDCVVLMSRQNDTLIPLAMQGLTRDTLGRRFIISEHPRLDIICQSTSPVRFGADCPLPDPFDGLLMEHDDDLPIHACMGLPLLFGDVLLGVLTLDSLTPNAFNDIPMRSLEALAAIAASTLKLALTLSQLEAQAKYSQQRLEALNEDVWLREKGDIIGNSDAIQIMISDIHVVAPSDLTIMIHGETGVGKELVARTIHQLSARKHQPMVYVNCAAIPENLVESELFGHVKGAFTGAERHRMGKFALADGGTLFLDEIGELPLLAQSKLLRVLQNNEIQPVGQDTVQTVNVRILAATNRDLKQEVQAGRFRADLYHRLSVYPIWVPPLRERTGDIALLVGYFLEQTRRKLGIVQLKIAAPALSYLIHYSWPGNVRELEHVINRSALKARALQSNQSLVTIDLMEIGTLDESLIATHPPQACVEQAVRGSDQKSLGLRTATDAFQRQLICQALEEAEYNWAKAARRLDVDRANLTRLAKRLGIQLHKNHSIE
ncbi:nitric oxide reductase transcriptional regulator NorR [Vibrio injensis]|uniref:nitric oxide reductase transcriptional regulator NorR n=1 Tax=Vibrio injensis TaxID=1307414 RepID=UPI00278C3E6F|nr:nitric oxide reductase transcriptional regulator NorR [Vibrio injensis]